MKSYNTLIGFMLAASLPAYAEPVAFFGLSYDFGDSVGVSLKVVSTNREDRGALAAGISYFPFSKKFGVDLGAGYVFRNGAATLGWDFLNSKVQVGVGYVKTKREDPSTAQVTAVMPVAPDRPLD